MSRAPVFEAMFNGKSLQDLKVMPLIDSVEFTEEVDKFDTVKIVLNEGEALTRATSLAQHGSVLQLSMGYVNEGIYPMTVVFLKSIEPNFESQQVTLTFTGYLKAMDVNEQDRALSNRTIQEIVEEIVSEYAVLEVGTITNGDVVLSDTTTQSKQTDLSVLEDIASRFGMKWKIEPGSTPKKWALSLYKLEYDKSKADNLLPIHAYPTKAYQAETKSLKLKSFKPKSNILGVSSRVEIRSNNPNQPIMADSSNIPSTIDPASVRGSEVVATVFGQVTRVQFMENVSDEEAASIIAAQLQQEDELAFVSAPESQLSEGIPNLRVGDVRQVVPHGIKLFEKVFAGPYLVTGTRHKISSQSGYDTWVTMNKNSLVVPPPPEPCFNAGGTGEGAPILIVVYPNGTGEGWYINFTADMTPVLGGPITQAEIEASVYWMSYVRRNVMGGSFGSTFFGGGTSTLLSGAGFGPSESSTVPNVAYSRAGEPVQIRVDWPENFNTDVVGLFSLATPVYDPYELGEVPYEFAGSGMGYFSMNQAAWDRLSEEERAQMIADAQAANQQDAISRMYALQAASTVAPNIITQMLQLGGGN